LTELFKNNKVDSFFGTQCRQHFAHSPGFVCFTKIFLWVRNLLSI